MRAIKAFFIALVSSLAIIVIAGLAVAITVAMPVLLFVLFVVLVGGAIYHSEKNKGQDKGH